MHIKTSLEHLLDHAKQILGDLTKVGDKAESALSDLQAVIQHGLDAVSQLESDASSDIKSIEKGAEAVG